MSEFPRDELSEDAILRQQLKECRLQIAHWTKTLESAFMVDLSEIGASLPQHPADVAKRLQREMLQYLRSTSKDLK